MTEKPTKKTKKPFVKRNKMEAAKIVQIVINMIRNDRAGEVIDYIQKSCKVSRNQAYQYQRQALEEIKLYHIEQAPTIRESMIESLLEDAKLAKTEMLTAVDNKQKQAWMRIYQEIKGTIRTMYPHLLDGQREAQGVTFNVGKTTKMGLSLKELTRPDRHPVKGKKTRSEKSELSKAKKEFKKKKAKL